MMPQLRFPGEQNCPCSRSGRGILCLLLSITLTLANRELGYVEEGGERFVQSVLHCPVMQHEQQFSEKSRIISNVLQRKLIGSWMVGGDNFLQKTMILVRENK